MKNFFIGVPKVLFAILCYLSAVLLAFLSGYFTVIFYSTSQSGWNMWAMGGLAGMLEFIKIMLAAAYPFLQYRDIKREKKVLFYLKICFFLSIMASMNFFLTGGEIERSPASKITELLYAYIPILEIIPVKFSKFMTTMSLSILIEAFIIFLPILAPIMFLEKDYQRRKKKTSADTNFDKLKEIVTVIPERLIDRLHQKVVGEPENKENDNLQIEEQKENIKVLEMNEKPKLKLLKNTNDLEEEENSQEFVQDKAEEEFNEEEYDDEEYDNEEYDDDENLTEEEQVSNFVQNSEMDKQKVLSVIYKYKSDNICPSVKQLMVHTGMKKNSLHNIKKEFEDSGILKTTGRRTVLLCDYNDALEKIWA